MFKILVVTIVFISSFNVFAGCKMFLTLENVSTSAVKVYNHRRDTTSVRINSSGWSAMSNRGWLTSERSFQLWQGQLKGQRFLSSFRCASERQYKIVYKCLDGANAGHIQTQYYPGVNAWATETDVLIKLDQC